MSKLIYVADDDIVTLRMIQSFLEKENYQVKCFENGDLLYEAFQQQVCDLVILDAIMPGNDGFTTGAKIRQTSNVPIIMVTGLETDTDYIFGISIGFDVYLTKPFNPEKLIAHVRSLLMKLELSKNLQSEGPQAELTFSDITIMPDKMFAYCNNEPLQLTNIEFGLLTFMFKNRNRAVSREELLLKIWGLDASKKTRVPDDTLKRLRRKLAEAGSRVSIDTVWGFGFRLSTKAE